MTAYDEQKIAELIRALPPAPEAWVQAAQELPLVRHQLDDIVARAEADLEFRRALIEDLEQALRHQGYEPEELPLEELRRRLTD
jgi:type VI protein secretion system component VasF